MSSFTPVYVCTSKVLLLEGGARLAGSRGTDPAAPVHEPGVSMRRRWHAAKPQTGRKQLACLTGARLTYLSRRFLTDIPEISVDPCVPHAAVACVEA